jgi:alpha-beta hydrolase superfamily lysophospholipase
VAFGHSMGSFMTQQFISEHGESLAGAVLSGTNDTPPGQARLALGLARLERVRVGPRGKSRLLNALVFGAFNKPFEPARTPFDWLSRDRAEVDRYIADPLCGGFESRVLTELGCHSRGDAAIAEGTCAMTPIRTPSIVAPVSTPALGSRHS